jgi:hypothetical protein
MAVRVSVVYTSRITRNPVDASVIIWFLNYWGYEYILNIPARIRQNYTRPIFETRHKVLFGEFGVHDSVLFGHEETLDTRIY